jgi:cytochrome P450
VAHGTLVDTKLGGYFIPKNTLIFANLGAVMRDPEAFPNPDQFKPERYLEQSPEGNQLVFKPHPRYHIMVFLLKEIFSFSFKNLQICFVFVLVMS